MPEFVHEWAYDGGKTTFTWLGDADVTPHRVYAFAFTAAGQMLLVSEGVQDVGFRGTCWLPGGGVEEGETPEEALARELVEEANATLHRCTKIGTQSADDTQKGLTYQAFYWARIAVHEQYDPTHEVTRRHLVAPDDFLDQLFWGRADPKAGMLLKRALEFERADLSQR